MPSEHEAEVQSLVAQWLRWAHADMKVALLTNDERIEPSIVAFHAQQATEKVLKALLVLHQIEFPRTHAIGALLALCAEAGITGAEVLNEASSLTRYAVTTRYPGEDEPITKEEAYAAAALASKVYAWALKQIETAPSRPADQTPSPGRHT